MLVVKNKKNTHFEKDYLDLRDSIKALIEGEDKKIIAITSIDKWEGKSTVAANIAYCLAEAGVKTLLIDGNLLRPSLDRKLNVENKEGFNKIIGGEYLREDVIVSKKDCLDIITAKEETSLKKIGENFNSIVSSIKYIGKEHDCIILDAISINDGLHLWYHEADGIIIVIKNGTHSKRDIVEGKNNIVNNGGNIIGAVLNGVKKI